MPFEQGAPSRRPDKAKLPSGNCARLTTGHLFLFPYRGKHLGNRYCAGIGYALKIFTVDVR